MTDEAFAVGIVTSEIIDAIRDGGTELLLNRNSLFNSVTYLHFSGMSYVDIAAELTTRQMIIFNYNQAKQRADELEDKRKKEGYTEDEIVAKDDWKNSEWLVWFTSSPAWDHFCAEHICWAKRRVC